MEGFLLMAVVISIVEVCVLVLGGPMKLLVGSIVWIGFGPKACQ